MNIFRTFKCSCGEVYHTEQARTACEIFHAPDTIEAPDYSAAALFNNPAKYEAERTARATLEGAAPALAAAVQRALFFFESGVAVGSEDIARMMAEFRHALKEAGL